MRDLDRFLSLLRTWKTVQVQVDPEYGQYRVDHTGNTVRVVQGATGGRVIHYFSRDGKYVSTLVAR